MTYQYQTEKSQASFVLMAKYNQLLSYCFSCDVEIPETLETQFPLQGIVPCLSGSSPSRQFLLQKKHSYVFNFTVSPSRYSYIFKVKFPLEGTVPSARHSSLFKETQFPLQGDTVPSSGYSSLLKTQSIVKKTQFPLQGTFSTSRHSPSSRRHCSLFMTQSLLQGSVPYSRQSSHFKAGQIHYINPT